MAYDLDAEDRHRIELQRETRFEFKPVFRPVVVRERHDGWSAERQMHFIEALAECGCVADACAEVGMSTASAYRLKARHDAIDFRFAWDSALDFATGRIEDGMFSRAINGVAVPHYFGGEMVGEHRRFDERLAQFILRYRKSMYYGRHRDRQDFVLVHPERTAENLAGGIEMIRTDFSRDRIEEEDAERAAAHCARDTAAAASAQVSAERAAAQAETARARAAASGDATDATIARETEDWAAGLARDAVTAAELAAARRDWVAHANGVLARRTAARTNQAGGDVAQPSQTSAKPANRTGSLPSAGRGGDSRKRARRPR